MKLGILLLFFSGLLPAQQAVKYELRFPNRAHHEAEVRVTFSGVRQPVLEVVMSRSSTGRYALHEFAKNVSRFRASDAEGHELTVSRPNPYGWNVSGHHGTVTVEYTLFGDRADGTYAAIDETHAHLNGPASLVWAHGFEKTPARLTFQAPEGANWTVATQLKPEPGGVWSAPTLDFLMDSPVEFSAHAMPEWQVGDAKFRLSLHHEGTEAEARAYALMCHAVTAEEEGIFGAFPKYDNGNYTFLVDYLPSVNGDGMEHRDSTVISAAGSLAEGAPQLIGTVAHEFFHSWNVKRIRPRDLEPFDFERANMSDALWFAEGFTQYYGPLTLKRAGLSSTDRFVRSLGLTVNTVLTSPGRKVFNAIEMSRQAPFVDAAAAIDVTNRANNFISYYTYGAAIALGVDLSIRARFPGKSLDDWMRTLWKEHPDVQKPYTVEDLQTALAHATGSVEFAERIFRDHIYGKEPMNYEALLAPAGILLRKTAAGKAWLGAPGLEFSDKGVALTAGTLRDTPLYAAGLDRGDKISQWDGRAMKSQQELDTWLAAHKPGDVVKLNIETRGGKKEVELRLAESTALEAVTYEAANKPLDAGILEFRDAWLGSKAVHPEPKVEKYCHVCQRTFAFEYEHCPYDGAALHLTQGNAPAPAEPRRGRR